MSKQAPLPVPELPEGLHPTGMPLWKKPPENYSDVFRAAVKNESQGASSKAAKVATMRLYGPIYDGWMGVSASAVAEALGQIDDDVEEIRVRINSPGGDVSEAMTILNMFRAHKARTVGVVDGIAASAGSFLAAGLDETVMSPGTQMMVHDAAGMCFGQAKDMLKAAEMLDSFSNSIASIYAQVAGGTSAEWRAVMVEESWYTADEAVEANLADRVGIVTDAGQTETAETDDDFEAAVEDMVRARYDLSVFNYAGRDAAPAPHNPPSASAVGSVNTSERGSAVAFTNEQLTTMRQELGLAGDADEATIVAALSEALAEQSEPPASPTPVAAAPAAPAAPASAAQATPSPVTPIPGSTMVIDSSAWEEREARIKRLEAADNKRRRDERDQVIATAVADGKFPQARKDHWQRIWDADPEGTRQVIDGLTKGVVPVNELGHADDADYDDELAHLYGPTNSKGA